MVINTGRLFQRTPAGRFDSKVTPLPCRYRPERLACYCFPRNVGRTGYLHCLFCSLSQQCAICFIHSCTALLPRSGIKGGRQSDRITVWGFCSNLFCFMRIEELTVRATSAIFKFRSDFSQFTSIVKGSVFRIF